MGETTEKIIADLAMIRTNPMAIQRYVIDLLEEMMGGDYIPQRPTTPFVFLLEAATMMCSGLSDQAEGIARGLYPQMSTDVADLYRHMSDVDYLNRYASPSKATISVVMLHRDIINLSNPVQDGGFKQITIPKETEFIVSRHKFGIYYPIDIRVTTANAVRISYDTTTISPMHTITDVKIDWSIFTHNKIDYVYIEIPVYQFALTTHNVPINVNVGMNEIIQFTDMFYFCRVYSKRGNDLVELVTTHSTDVYDPSAPTALLTVMESSVQIVIPQIYFFNNRLDKEIRVDIYTTEGETSIDLGNYNYDDYSVRWRDLDGNSTEYVSPLGKLTTVTITSDSVTSGGTNGLTYDELRTRVLTARRRREIPVSHGELYVTLSDMGYTLLRSIDDLAGRIFHACKVLPPMVGSQQRADGMVIGTTIDNRDLESKYIYNHEQKFVLLPGHLYELRNEKVFRLTDDEHDDILAMDGDAKVDLTRQRTLLYQCLHYVVDETDGFITSTPYILNYPVVTGRWVKAENISTIYYITSDTYNLRGEDGIYTLTIRTKSSASVQELDDDQVHAQLAFIPVRESKRVYVSGVQIGKNGPERIYEFKINSKLDIGRDDVIRLEGFTMYTGDTARYGANLDGDYEIFFAISNVGDLDTTRSIEFDLKGMIGHHLLPSDAQGITGEHIGIELGKKMDLVLSGCRSTVEPESYERYDVDVPATYTENVYERDENNRLVLVDDPVTGNRGPVIVHRQGDVIEDDEGNIVYQHRAGDVKLDKDGDPIVSEEIGPSRYLELLLVDGRYRLATDPNIADYYNRLPLFINDYLVNDIAPLNQKMLERTELYYTVTKTVGNVTILVTNTDRRTISGHQSMSVSFYVTESVYQDDDLKTSLTTGTVEAVHTWLDNVTLSKSDLIGTLRAMGGDDVLGVDMTWHGELSEIDTFTLVDESDGISMAKQLILRYDGLLTVEDLIEVEFLRQNY